MRRDNGKLAARRRQERGGSALVVVLALCVAVLVAIGFLALKRGAIRGNLAPGAETRPELSESTRQVLARLVTPVSIRYYSFLDPASVPENTRKFADQVGNLLSEYEREGNSKVKLTRLASGGDSEANAASADGIKPFNQDKGDACYLGVTLVCEERKESIAQLSPEWPQAVEPDITRAIVRVSTPKPPVSGLAASMATPPAAAVVEEVKRALPELGSMSMTQAQQVLRDQALKTFTATVKELEAQSKEARERIAAAPGEAERQAALKELQRVEAEHSEKLKEIAAKLQSELKAVESLKKEDDR